MKLTLWDILAIMTLLALLFMGIIFLQIFVDPFSTINPFPPSTLPPTLMIPSATPTLRSLPPTWTHTPQQPGLFATLRPTSTLLPTATGFRLPTFTHTPTPTSTPTNTPTITNTATITNTPKPTRTRTPVPPTPDLTETESIALTQTAEAGSP